jgi:hypothetical protein
VTWVQATDPGVVFRRTDRRFCIYRGACGTAGRGLPDPSTGGVCSEDPALAGPAVQSGSGVCAAAPPWPGPRGRR